LRISDIEKIINDETPAIQIIDRQLTTDNDNLFDFKNIYELPIINVNKQLAYLINCMYPFDSEYNKIPVFASGILEFIKKKADQEFFLENGKKVMIVSGYNFEIKKNSRILYTIEFENYGFFNLFAAVKIKPIKLFEL